jgi:LysR family glycine cleavage system transcriptional activator
MLACFETLARLGSRETAAVELNVTEGAVAKQLRALEQWLNMPLFESGGRSRLWRQLDAGWLRP